jgi:alginate O-acetyltransferase complex protein AlgI
MLFNSLEFIIFGFIFFLGWGLLKNWSLVLRQYYLAVFSLFFYGWWDFRFIFLLLLTVTIDFIAVECMDRFQKKKIFLISAIFINLSILFFFKYFSMAFGTVNSLRDLMGMQALDPIISNVILPAGISFYTFQSMSYSIDFYRGEIKKSDSYVQYVAYVSMFPQLIAGPIERASHLLPQLNTKMIGDTKQLHDGLCLIVLGFFKKTFIADNLAYSVNLAFQNFESYSAAFSWWIIMIAFSFQILFDFSGYSDIARGLAKWMGMEFIVNFNNPYRSVTFKEFWSRWHISLSTWFRDYVYIPLGGNKNSPLRNTAITMLLSGLWHGASWNFVLWGGLHSILLILERKLSRFKFKIPYSIVLILILLSWIPFRAENLHQTYLIISKMFDVRHFFNFSELGTFKRLIVPLSFAILVEFSKMSEFIKIEKKWILILLALLSIFYAGPNQSFIYFQF